MKFKFLHSWQNDMNVGSVGDKIILNLVMEVRR